MRVSLIAALCALLSVAWCQQECMECASVSLEDNWEITSLPTRPKDLKYDDKCNTPSTTEYDKECSTGVCFELLLPVEERVAFVRGCYSRFINFETTYSSSSLKEEKCEYGDVTGTIRFNESVSATAKVGMHVSLAGIKASNKNFANDVTLYTDTTRFFQGCQVATAKSCVSCSRFGSSGSCKHNTEETCQGAYCVKYEGYLDDVWFETRTCSAVSPFSTDQCSWMEGHSSIPLLNADLNMEYKGTHCFCSGDRCNSSPVPLPSMCLLLICLSIVYRALPLSSSSL